MAESAQQTEKKLVAAAAADRVASDMVIGLGSGTTAALFVEELGRRIVTGFLTNISGVPTSNATAKLARSAGVAILADDDIPDLDLAIDGADEIDPAGNMLKGRGGALLREKLVAACARTVIIMADSSKRVQKLGHGCPVVVEVPAFGWKRLARLLVDLPDRLGGPATVNIRQTQGQPFITDNGNVLLDMTLRHGLDDPHKLDQLLAAMPGVLGHGLFVGFHPVVLLADDSGAVQEIRFDAPDGQD